MATTGVINTTLLRVYVGSVAYACAVDAALSFTRDLRDATCKDSGSWRDILPGRMSGTVTLTGLYKDTDAPTDGGAIDIYDDFVAGTNVTILYSTEVSGDTYWSCPAYITAWGLSSSGSEDNVTYDATFELTGAATKGTVA